MRTPSLPGRQRVVVTGFGQVSALGSDLASFSRRLLGGESGVRRMPELKPPGMPDPIAAPVRDWQPDPTLAPRVIRSLSRTTLLAHSAALEAVRSAGLAPGSLPSSGGIYVGTGFGGQATCEVAYRECFAKPDGRPNPTIIPVAMTNASAGFLAGALQLKGPNLTLSVACAASTHAVGQAFRLLRTGDAELMLAGGADAPLADIIMAAWNAMRVLAPANDDPTRACRPFSADWEGLVLGEGAGFVILETLEHATRRNARPLVEILGYGANADAGHITHPDPIGVEACLALALEDAKVGPEAVGYVNAHGTGTPINDRVESEALSRLFRARAERILVSSTKAAHGHAMGATGALELVATIVSLLEDRFPPTVNLVAPDPELPRLDFVIGEARKAVVDVALTSSFAFGGNNAVLALRRC